MDATTLTNLDSEVDSLAEGLRGAVAVPPPCGPCGLPAAADCAGEAGISDARATTLACCCRTQVCSLYNKHECGPGPSECRCPVGSVCEDKTKLAPGKRCMVSCCVHPTAVVRAPLPAALPPCLLQQAFTLAPTRPLACLQPQTIVTTRFGYKWMLEWDKGITAHHIATGADFSVGTFARFVSDQRRPYWVSSRGRLKRMAMLLTNRRCCCKSASGLRSLLRGLPLPACTGC